MPNARISVPRWTSEQTSILCATANLLFFRAKDNENYTMLVLLAETLSSRPLPGSVELVSCLLETLNKVIHDATSSATDKSYNEQLLMTAIENAATHVPVSQIAYIAMYVINNGPSVGTADVFCPVGRLSGIDTG